MIRRVPRTTAWALRCGVLAMAVGLSAPASALGSSCTSNDASRIGAVFRSQLKYEDESKYPAQTREAARAWDLGSVYIGPARIGNELLITDIREPNSTAMGTFYCSGKIKYNRYTMDDEENRYSAASDKRARYWLAAHEMGHALGLAHWGGVARVMYPFRNSTRVAPTKDEIDLYYRKHGPHGSSDLNCMFLLQTQRGSSSCNAEPLIKAGGDAPELEPFLVEDNVVTANVTTAERSLCESLYQQSCLRAYAAFLESVIDGADEPAQAMCWQLYARSCGHVGSDFLRDVINFQTILDPQCGLLYNGRCGDVVGAYVQGVIDGAHPTVEALCIQYYSRTCGRTFGDFIRDVDGTDRSETDGTE